MLLQSLLRPVLTPIMRGIFDPAQSVSAAWSPTDLASLGAWFDPSDLSTMFQDAAGTTPVTAAGQPVGLILDKSGNGYHASQSTSTARPNLEIDGSGNYYLDFDGIDNYLNTDAIDLTGTSEVTLFIGAFSASLSPAIFLETSVNAIGTAGAFHVTAAEDAANIGTFVGGGSATTKNKTTAGQPAHTVTVAELSSVFTAGVGFATVRVNGVSQDVSVVIPGNSTGNFGDHQLFIGARSGGVAPFNGKIYSLVIGGAAYDAATVLEAEAWVADKTGVTL